MDFNLSTIISLAALALGLAIILYLVGTIAADVDHFKRRYSRYRELRRMERVGRRFMHWQRISRRARAREMRRTIRGRRVVQARVSYA